MRIAYNENQKLFFRTLKNMRQGRTETIIYVKDKDGTVITEVDKIVENIIKNFWKAKIKE